MKEYIGKWIRHIYNTTLYYIITVDDNEVYCLEKDNDWTSNIKVETHIIEFFTQHRFIIVDNVYISNYEIINIVFI